MTSPEHCAIERVMQFSSAIGEDGQVATEAAVELVAHELNCRFEMNSDQKVQSITASPCNASVMNESSMQFNFMEQSMVRGNGMCSLQCLWKYAVGDAFSGMSKEFIKQDTATGRGLTGPVATGPSLCGQESSAVSYPTSPSFSDEADAHRATANDLSSRSQNSGSERNEFSCQVGGSISPDFIFEKPANTSKNMARVSNDDVVVSSSPLRSDNAAPIASSADVRVSETIDDKAKVSLLASGQVMSPSQTAAVTRVASFEAICRVADVEPNTRTVGRDLCSGKRDSIGLAEDSANQDSYDAAHNNVTCSGHSGRTPLGPVHADPIACNDASTPVTLASPMPSAARLSGAMSGTDSGEFANLHLSGMLAEVLGPQLTEQDKGDDEPDLMTRPDHDTRATVAVESKKKMSWDTYGDDDRPRVIGYKPLAGGSPTDYTDNTAANRKSMKNNGQNAPLRPRVTKSHSKSKIESRLSSVFLHSVSSAPAHPMASRGSKKGKVKNIFHSTAVARVDSGANSKAHQLPARGNLVTNIKGSIKNIFK